VGRGLGEMAAPVRFATVSSTAALRSCFVVIERHAHCDRPASRTKGTDGLDELEISTARAS
jgi:hypothetical protein